MSRRRHREMAQCISACNGLVAGKPNSKARDNSAENACKPPWVSGETQTRVAEPANSRLFDCHGEISGSARMRGGAGRTRTSNQAVMSANNRYFCARSLTFVRVWLRRFIGYPLVGREAVPLHRHEGPALIERGIRGFGRTTTLDGKIRISRRFRMQRLLDKMAN